jgi:hypothetical protein
MLDQELRLWQTLNAPWILRRIPAPSIHLYAALAVFAALVMSLAMLDGSGHAGAGG